MKELEETVLALRTANASLVDCWLEAEDENEELSAALESNTKRCEEFKRAMHCYALEAEYFQSKYEATPSFKFYALCCSVDYMLRHPWYSILAEVQPESLGIRQY